MFYSRTRYWDLLAFTVALFLLLTKMFFWIKEWIKVLQLLLHKDFPWLFSSYFAKLVVLCLYCTAWKVSVFGVILVNILPQSDWIRRDTPYLRISPDSVLMRENAVQNNSEHAHCLRSVVYSINSEVWEYLLEPSGLIKEEDVMVYCLLIFVAL